MKHTLLHLSLGLLLLFLHQTGVAQEKLDAAALQQDLDIIKEIAIGLSPKMSKEEIATIEETIAEKKTELEGQQMAALDYLKFLSEIDLETQFDEHASMGVGERVLVPLLMQSKLFPLPIKMLGTQVVVNTKEAAVPYGSVLDTINGLSVDSLIRDFVGDFESTFSQRRLEQQFSMMYLVKIGSSETFDVVYRPAYTPPNGATTLKKQLAGLDFNSYQQVFQNIVYPLDKDKQSHLINTAYYPASETYYLQLNSFSRDDLKSDKHFLGFLQSEPKKFKKEFKKVFKDMRRKGAKKLIIDLRNNGGGNVRVPSVLYSYIAKSTFREDVRLEMPDLDIPEKEYIVRVGGDKVKKVAEVDKAMKRITRDFKKEDGIYVDNYVKNKIWKPSPHAFTGEVYLLVGGKSCSASSCFTALFKSRDRGVIVGEEIGCSHHSITAGVMIEYVLPNTKIEVTAPIMLVHFTDDIYNQVPERKVMPNITFSENDLYRYFLKEKDIELEKVLKIVGE